ncbi:putative structural protein [uncultured Caudovirales phage]|uniref:Putative structural protein n=1 Tax=uncultured Caudovirales phage TaxID=2100421 RepID=A0A2H4JAI8_9CAUD|nr:putative structural protein [uncultured Caudovirales phage]
MAQYTKRYEITASTYIDGPYIGNTLEKFKTDINYANLDVIKIDRRVIEDYFVSKDAFIKFDVSELKYKRIISAKLYMYPRFTVTGDNNQSLAYVGIENNWNASKMTGKNIHDTLIYGNGSGNGYPYVSGSWVYYEIRSLIGGNQREDRRYNKNTLKNGCILTGEWENPPTNMTFDSVNGTNKPYLIIDYEDAPPTTPTVYEPINIYANNNEDVVFKWKYNTSVEDKQNGVEIRIKHELGTWYTAYTSTTYSNDSISLTPTQHKLETGKNEWQIRTRNQFGEWSPWSEIVSFNALGLPKAPVVTVVQEGARPIINWTATYQQVYQVQVLNSNNEIVHDSGSIASLSNKTYKVPVFLTNGNYTGRARIKNEFDLFSNWGTKAFTINLSAKEPFNAVIYPTDDFTFIKFNVDADYYLIYRADKKDMNFKIVGRTIESQYKDYAIQGRKSYVYFVRAVQSEEFTDSKKVVIETFLKYPILSTVNDFSNRLKMHSNLDEPLKRSYSFINEGERRFYLGRKFAAKEFSEFKNNSYSLAFYIVDKDLAKLEELYNENAVVLYRDNYRKVYCTIEDGINVTSAAIGGYTIQMLLTETDYKEELNA